MCHKQDQGHGKLEKLGGQIFFENCKEVWGHASLKNLKYRHSVVQSC